MKAKIDMEPNSSERKETEKEGRRQDKNLMKYKFRQIEIMR